MAWGKSRRLSRPHIPTPAPTAPRKRAPVTLIVASVQPVSPTPPDPHPRSTSPVPASAEALPGVTQPPAPHPTVYVSCTGGGSRRVRRGAQPFPTGAFPLPERSHRGLELSP